MPLNHSVLPHPAYLKKWSDDGLYEIDCNNYIFRVTEKGKKTLKEAGFNIGTLETMTTKTITNPNQNKPNGKNGNKMMTQGVIVNTNQIIRGRINEN